jgi:hypothetical protein
VAVLIVTLACTTAAAAFPLPRSGSSAVAVPWRLAGQGWSVVEDSAASLGGAAKAKTVFYLVNPKGRKYPFYVTPTATAYPALTLLDWSGDRRRILVYREAGSSTPTVVEQISLATGAVVSRFKLPAGALPEGYTRPSGTSVLAVGFSRPGIYRYDLTGGLQRVLARGTRLGIPKTLDSPSGTFLLAGTVTRLLRISSAAAHQ